MKEYHEHPDWDDNKRSSLLAIEHILNLPKGVSERHKAHLLRHSIWLLTTANGKNPTEGKSNVRFVSQGVLAGGPKIRHDHNPPIVVHIRGLLDDPLHYLNTLRSADACLVTHEEHKALNKVDKTRPGMEGWERYRAANIRVFDRKSKKFIP